MSHDVSHGMSCAPSHDVSHTHGMSHGVSHDVSHVLFVCHDFMHICDFTPLNQCLMFLTAILKLSVHLHDLC